MTDATDTTTPAGPRHRQPAPPRARASRWVVAGLAVLVVVAALLAVTLHDAGRGVSGRMLDYRLLDERHVEVVFDVTKAPLAEASCTLRARDEGSRVVGTAEVVVGPRRDDRRTTTVTRTVTTTGRAERAELVGCRVTRTR